MAHAGGTVGRAKTRIPRVGHVLTPDIPLSALLISMSSYTVKYGIMIDGKLYG